MWKWKCLFTWKTTYFVLKFQDFRHFLCLQSLWTLFHCVLITVELFCANLISAYIAIWCSYLNEQMNFVFLSSMISFRFVLEMLFLSSFLGRCVCFWTCRFRTLFPDFYFSIILNIFIPFVSYKVYLLAKLCLSFMPVISLIFGYPQTFFSSI